MKYAFITGASSGIGACAALKFAEEGYHILAVCNSNQAGLEAVADRIRSHGGLCSTALLDVADFQAVRKYFAGLESNHTLPELIINNAGISRIGLLQDLPEEEWQNVISINLTGVYHVCRAAIPYFLERGSGRILNVSSMWGNVGASCEVAYSASKGGVNTFTRALAKELAPSGIPVNAVAFGCVDTTMNHFLSESEKKELEEEIPAGYFLPAEAAADILYEVSQLHPYVTGQIITADGGYT